MSPEVRRLWTRRFAQSAARGRPVAFEYPHEHSTDGVAAAAASARWLRATVAPLGREGDSNNGRERFSYVVEDISERWQAAVALQHESDALNARTRALARSEQRLRDLHAVTSRADLDFDHKVEQLLDMGRTHLGLDIGVLAQIDNNRYTVHHALTPPDVSLPAGWTCDAETTFCREVVARNGPVAIAHARQEGRGDGAAYAAFGLETYIGAPIPAGGHAPSNNGGVLCFSARAPRPTPFSASDQEFLQLMAQWIGGELARQQAEEKFRVLFEQSSEAHLLFDENGVIDCNNAAVTLLRCQSKAQMLSLHPAVLSPEYQPDGRRSQEKSVEMDARARETGFHRFEWTHRKMDGEDFPVEVTLTPVLLNNKNTLLAVWHDLSQRKQAEEALRESNRFAESITEHSTSIIYVFDLDTRTNTYSNRDVAEFLGYGQEQIAAMGADFLPTIVHPDDLPFMLRHLEEFENVPDGQAVEFEQRVRHASGEWRWLWNREVVFKCRPDDMPCQIMGTAQDITERKRAEASTGRLLGQLLESEERNRRLADASFETLAITEEGVVRDANTRCGEMFGYASDQLIGMRAEQFVAPCSRALVLQKNRSNDESLYEAVCLRADGSTFVAEIRGRTLPYHGRPARLTAVRDISARKENEEALRRAHDELEERVAERTQELALVNEFLRESEQRYRFMADAMPQIVWTAQPDGCLDYYNRRWFEYTGLTLEETKD